MSAQSEAVLEPLRFPDQVPHESAESETEKAPCFLCDRTFHVTDNKEAFLGHLVSQHKLVIADVQLIADLQSYAEYWKKRFTECELTEFCSVIKTNSKESDNAPSEEFYLLCDALPEDKTLRENLQKKRLDNVLESQQKEREDANFSRGCLFCRKHFDGNRASIFNHMAQDHGFNVGLPDNLVHVNEFLDLLEEKLNSLSCLYCEKIFKDRTALKDHMRKKQHRRLNPRNTSYDRFYVINYLELGKNWLAVQAEDDGDTLSAVAASAPPTTSNSDENPTDTEDEAWSDWQEEGATAVCLFCDLNYSKISSLMEHLKDSHGFDFEFEKERLRLSFYQMVKVVNYVRRCVYKRVCVFCECKFGDGKELTQHMDERGHCRMPQDTRCWDQPEYFFPTFENDNLLCHLQTAEEDNGEQTTEQRRDDGLVFPEDLAGCRGNSILRSDSLRRELLS